MFEDTAQPLEQLDPTTTSETNTANLFIDGDDLSPPSTMDSVDSSISMTELTPELSESESFAAIDPNLTGISESDPLAGVKTDDSLMSGTSENGLTGTVAIERDEFGVPHINADSLNDSIYAQGYVHAQDRLWQMEYRRRAAKGTLAEVFGTDLVEQDTSIRTLGIKQAAETAYQNLSPESKQIVDRYTAGINAYLDSNPDLPPEFASLGYEPEAWQPTDVMATLQLQTFAIGTTSGGELERFDLLQQGVSPERIEQLLPEYGVDDTTILKPKDIDPANFSVAEPTEELVIQGDAIEQQLTSGLADLFPNVEASNNWVVSGDRTTTGAPMLAFDPHLSLESPSAWYQSEIDSNELQAIGVGLPGIPGVQVGRNQDIAWGQTATQADAQDFYILEENEAGSGYIYQGEERLYETREETIQVKDSEAVTIQVRESVYGPVVSDALGVEQAVALKAVGLEPANGTLEAFAGIGRAKNWDDFTSSLESVGNPNFNFVYADRAGNIGYTAPGNYPIRQPGHTGKYPVPGTGEFDWQGFIPKEEVPQLYNPESGYIVTANNQQVPDNYPYQINGNYAEPYRAERITELIESKDKLSIEDMQDIQLDRVTLLYRDFRPILEQLQPNSPQAQEWRDRLLNWDGNTLPDSQEASVFEAWYIELTKLPGEEVGREVLDEPRFLLNAIQQGDPSCDRQGSPAGCDDEVALALDNALARFDGDVPAWGEIHQATFEPVGGVQSESSVQVPVGGDKYTVNVSPVGIEDFGNSFGVSYRQIIELANPEHSLYVNPPGQSSDIEDENFADQLPLWQEGEYLPMKTEDYTVSESLILEPQSE